ncbi:MAG: N-acetyltransferase [Akkermansia sp.]|nr:N-acetyltransferase [Akkermansia sp.]
MKEERFVVRPERPEEHRQVEELVRESFWDVYRPGCWEHYVLHVLREHADYVPELALVAEQGGRLIGQCAFVRTTLAADDGRRIPIMTMGPICIAPAYKRQGYGKMLLDEAIRRATALGCGALCFEGDIAFYGKSGFTYAASFGLRYHGLPEGADSSFFLCRELIPGYLAGITGEYATPAAYLVEEAAVAAYDATFPPKEKHRLPGQLF